MTISSLGLQQIAFSGVASARDNLDVAQNELSSGRRSERYGGFGADAARLVNAESLVARSDASIAANDLALARLSLVGAGLETIEAGLADFEAALTSALANGDGALLADAAADAGRTLIASLNARFGEVYLFAGDQGGARPVNGSALSDLTGDPSADFASGAPFTISVDAVAAGSGPTAEAIGAPVFAALSDLVNAAPGSPLSAGDAAIVQDVLERIRAERVRVEGARALVGVDEGRFERQAARLVETRDLAELVAADIEASDPAEAITRLNQDQLALEASVRALAVINQVSLLNFL